MQKRQPDIVWGVLIALALIVIRPWQRGDAPSPGIFMYFAGGIIIRTIYTTINKKELDYLIATKLQQLRVDVHV